MTKKPTDQMHLPGIDPKKMAYKEFLANNPQPSTFAEAETFLRKHSVTVITLKRDHDAMRSVLKQTNNSEDKEKHEYTTQLSIFNKAERESAFLEIAIKIYLIYMDLEAPKYQ